MKHHASMNRIYRLVWNRALKAWIAVAETARGRGKSVSRRLVAAVLAVAAGHALAAPVAGQVTAGLGSIAQSGGTTTITQATQNLSLSWQSFNTAASETVNFVQPSASAIAVNRIHDTNGTQFLGHLNANGQVYLINPNGILFGSGAQVNVGGLVASTLDVSDASLTATSRRFSGDGTGSVVNQGTITGRYVALLGNTVSNQGTITANSGAVALGAGSAVTLTFADDNLIGMQVEQSTLNNLAENGGLIQADGGMVLMSAGAKDALLASVVNNTGVIEARTAQNVNGTIVLDGGNLGSLTNSGTLDASGKGAGETGGTVKVLGGTVDLAAGTRIDVSGDAGGGTVLVGGNFHGAGPERNAATTNVAADASIDADAITHGNGGNVAIWSNDHTTFDGTVTARGGAGSGNGGQVETSGGKLTIGQDARVSTLAPKGEAGNWLLDPKDFTIYGAGYGPGDMLDTTLSSNLDGGSITIYSSLGGSGSNGDILINGAAVVWTHNTTLTLSAYRNVKFDSTNGGYIDCTGAPGACGIVLQADNTGTGTGTVDFGAASGYVAASPSGTISIYYNPTSYSSPTDYAGYLVVQLGAIYGTLNTYMAININATVANKTYDSTTNGSVSGASVLGTAPDGSSSDQHVTVNTAGATAVFSDKNVGTGKTTTISGISLSGADAGKYYVNGLTSKTANITPKTLTESGLSVAASKVYDGGTVATLLGSASLQAAEAVGAGNTSDGKAYTGDTVSLTGTATGTYDSKDVATASSVTYGGLSLTGGQAGNYSLTMQGTSAATITPKTLTESGLSVAASKVYDGGTAATLLGSASLQAAESVGAGNTSDGKAYTGDTVSLTGTATGTYDSKDVATASSVTYGGLTLTGGQAGNYSLSMQGNSAATIAAKTLTESGLSVAASKTYDGTTAATVLGAAALQSSEAAGVGTTADGKPYTGDTVSLSGTATGTYDSRNVGIASSVTYGGLSLTGGQAGNYSLSMQGNSAASITAKSVTLTAPNVTKTYDGGAAYTVTAGDLTTLGASLVGGDAVTAATIAYADKNAGAGNKTVDLNAATISDGNGGANYSVTLAGNSTSTITAKSVTLTAPSVTKTYDGGLTYTTTAGDLTALGASLVGSDTVTAATIAYADKNAGLGTKTVNLNTATISDGNGGANYSVTLAGNGTSTIDQKALTLGGITASNKEYDGATAAMLNTAGVTFTGKVAGDTVTLGGAGTGDFADKNVGNGKTVTVSGYTLGGLDAGNYTVGQPSGLTANITPAALSVAGLTAGNKVYDGTAAATVNTAGEVFTGKVGGDTVTVDGAGSFTDKNVANGKAVSVTISGADAGNYTLTQPGLTANITAAPLTVSGITAADKVYDGTTAATVSTAGVVLAGKLGGDVVTVSATGAFADPNAGNGKIVALGSTYGGADAGNYTITDQASTTANITPASLTLTANGASQTYSGTAYSGGNGVAYSGFVNGETSAVLGGALTYGGTSQGATAVGSYVIAPGGLTSSNYTLSFVDGTLTIVALPAPVTAPPPQVQNAVTQLQGSVLPPQATAEPLALSISPTITVSQTSTGSPGGDGSSQGTGIQVNTMLDIRGTGPTLQIVNGGVRLPQPLFNPTDSKDKL